MVKGIKEAIRKSFPPKFIQTLYLSVESKKGENQPAVPVRWGEEASWRILKCLGFLFNHQWFPGGINKKGDVPILLCNMIINTGINDWPAWQYNWYILILLVAPPTLAPWPLLQHFDHPPLAPWRMIIIDMIISFRTLWRQRTLRAGVKRRKRSQIAPEAMNRVFTILKNHVHLVLVWMLFVFLHYY